MTFSSQAGLATIRAGAGIVPERAALPKVDPLEVDLTLLGIHAAAAADGRDPLTIVRARKGAAVVKRALALDPDERDQYTHTLAVLDAAEKHLIKEQQS